MDDRRELLEAVCGIATAAGDAIMEIYEREFSVELKDDRSPLTEADRAAHRIIVDRLGRLPLELPVLSEESGQDAFRNRLEWNRFWLVDPLDGTKEFIKRNGEFTVNIALIDRHAPVLGVVGAPALGSTYSGIAGVGAWKTNGDGPVRIEVRRPAAEPLRVVGSRSHASPELATFLEQIGPHEIKPMGSSLKICLVAEGEADLYPRLGPTSEWDTAAAHAVLISAGGSMMDLTGEPLAYNAGESILNPHFLALGDDIRDRLPGFRTN
ncbi:MAG: 3'(2'),5'-bisphosphate nucleotidase CysQ [Gammaproteobacteria bacterium]|jgi:3'(2'), 5'-bisphosphate nucleotidase